MIIYKTTNLVNNKIYVGKSTGTRKDDKYYFGSGLYVKRAIQKYGMANFKRDTLEECSSNNVDQRETHWINKLDARNPKVGYNIAPGGEGGLIVDRDYLAACVKEKQWGPNSALRRSTLSKRVQADNNPMALRMKIIRPNGKVEVINSIRPWCIKNKVSYDTILRWAHGGLKIMRRDVKDTSVFWTAKRRFLNWTFKILDV